jgi:hypothetical protein
MVKKLKIIAMLCIVLLSIPLIAFAASHQEHGSHGDEKAMEKNHHDEMGQSGHGMKKEHAKMASDGSVMMIVGSSVSKGVKGMAHIKDVSATMAKMGMKTTHHFMIAFMDEATGEQVETGTVALKITNPDAKVGETIKLMGMDGHFGADIVLDMEGEYHFKLGTKLADGKNRTYHFHQVVK